ncbi:hypothetical protein LA66_00025 [Aureimonas altamirensis]|uniref:Uncharacterized protein n=1 Tax=Aureimonas altamirensis TaxID=370622 RepID=A0A0B1Q890_9HYPH|nr:hypothetical protein LA66_00025 [Aureimonas altamirensis]
MPAYASSVSSLVTIDRYMAAAPDIEAMLFAQRRSCKAVSTCREAVQMWCDGYTGADRDNDGIPCENVCRTKAEVDEIRADIGC